MKMRENKTKNKLRQGEKVYGSLVSFYAPGVVEVLGTTGLDFVILDGEHGGLTMPQIIDMTRAAEAFDITPMARVPNHDADVITAFLDTGVQGVMLPHVNTEEEADKVSKAARYYPLGNRGHFAGGRPALWGLADRFEYFKHANEQTLVMAQFEEIKALDHLDAILEVDGVDAIVLGPGDLAQSMGWPSAEKLETVIDTVIQKTVQAGKWVSDPGVKLGQDGRASKYAKQGSNIWFVTPQEILREGFMSYKTWIDTQATGS